MQRAAPNEPTKHLTWEHKAVRRFLPNSSSQNTAAQRAQLFMSFMLTDKLRKTWGGTFSDQGGGTVRFTPDEIAGPHSWYGGINNLFLSSMVGKQFVIAAANSAGNEGSFTITAVDTTDGLWVEYTNGSAVFESDSTASGHVREGDFTLPWVCTGSGAGSTGKGYGHDNRDRLLTESDMQCSTSSTGNKNWITWRNQNNAEILLCNWNTSSSYNYYRAYWQIVLEGSFFSGGTSTVIPSAPIENELMPRANLWFVDTPQSDCHWMSMGMDDTGKNHFMWFATDNEVQHINWCFEAADPNPGTLTPWNGNHNVADMSRSTNHILTHDSFNNNAQMQVAIDKDSANGGPFKVSCYLSAEMASSSMASEIQSEFADELSRREHALYPMGLFCNTLPVRGRIGWIRDIYWHNDRTIDGTFHSGGFMPHDGSRDWVKVGHMVFPWDGTTVWRKN